MCASEPVGIAMNHVAAKQPDPELALNCRNARSTYCSFHALPLSQPIERIFE